MKFYPANIRFNSFYKFLLLVLIMLLQTGNAYAWGKLGHRLIARIAAQELSLEATNEIQRILGDDSISSVALWADVIKKQRPETAIFHYCDFPQSPADDRFVEPEDSQENVVSAIYGFLDTLQGPRQTSNKKQEALKFIIHLVGDIHQPMHCNPKGDAGGNMVKLTFNGIPTNLHKLWDGELLEFAGLSEDEYLSLLMNDFYPQEKATLQKENPGDWARESCQLAVSYAYRLPADHVIGDDYYKANIDVINRRLVQAGLRLGQLLEDISRVSRKNLATETSNDRIVLEYLEELASIN